MLKNDNINNKTIFANWKMNFSKSQALSFCKNLTQSFDQEPELAKKLVLLSPLMHVSLIDTIFPNIILGTQDLSSLDKDQGSFTGETSAYMLKSANVTYGLIGHFERRKFFNETQNIINIKIKNALTNQITPIICFGEASLEDDPLEELKKNLQTTDQKVIYAYEPYWAIGNNNFKLEQILPNIAKLHQYLQTNTQSPNNSFIYGGSVNSQNIAQLKTIKYLDGLLVGSASLDLSELLKILRLI